MTLYCEALRTLLTRCISFWINYLIWNYCYCYRLYFLLNCYISLSVGQYNSVSDRLCMRAYMSKLDLLCFDRLYHIFVVYIMLEG